MKLLDWLTGKPSRDHVEAVKVVALAKEAQRVAVMSADKRSKESIERDLLYLNGLMRNKKNDNGGFDL